MSENHNNGRSSNSNNTTSSFANWLGFSLSPHMKMEGAAANSSPTEQHNQYHHYTAHPQQQQEHSPASNMSMFLSVEQQQMKSASAVFFDVGERNNGGFLHAPLNVMPLKSDGSLCILEALSRSQQSEVPKLENFLGAGQERQTMALSLDSMYYPQTTETQRHHQQQQYEYLSAMTCQGIPEDGYFKNWINTTHIVNQNANSGLNDNNDYSSSVSLAHHVTPAVSCGELQSLALSMSPGSQSSCVTAVTTNLTDNAIESCKKRGFGKVGPKQTVHRKSIDTFGQRTSQYRGVTKHRWTGRYEAHLWDNSCKKEGQTRKGRQVYLGGYDMEDKAARAYDLAALKYWGLQTHTNFSIESYKVEIEEMQNMTRQEYVAHLRRKSSGFSRGASMYRGVTRHHQHGRWQARIGRVAGNKDLYLGTFSTQEEAAEAYDVAAIKFRGLNAVTNFDISRYNVDKIMTSNTLLAVEQAKRNIIESTESMEDNPTAENVIDCIASDHTNATHWKMVQYNPNGEQQTSSNMNGGYGNPPFSLALQDLVRPETASPTSQGMENDSVKFSSAQYSNPSSLVTSMNSSREGSPEKNGSTSSPLFSPSGSRFMSVATVVHPWTASAHDLRPAVATIPVAHLPVFAWGDA